MWPFSSSTEAGPSTLPSLDSRTTDSAPQLVESLDSHSAPAPTVNKWETTLKDEEAYQAKVYPDFNEVPGCMWLMDEFFMCYALGPQLRNFYRHGHYRDCMWKWADFKYCLSLKSEDEETRRQLWIKRRAEYWARRRVGGSSEDVWDRRSTPLVNFPPVQHEEIPTENPA